MANQGTDATPTPKPKPRPRFSAREIGALLLAVLALIFVLENTRRVKIRFIGPQVTTHVWVAMLVSLAAGVLIGWLVRRRRHDD